MHGEFHMDNFTSQDHMAWETQGPLADRVERTSGRGRPRRHHVSQICCASRFEAVQRGEDPVGINRDPAKDEIDSHDSRRQQLRRFFICRGAAAGGIGVTVIDDRRKSSARTRQTSRGIEQTVIASSLRFSLAPASCRSARLSGNCSYLSVNRWSIAAYFFAQSSWLIGPP